MSMNPDSAQDPREIGVVNEDADILSDEYTTYKIDEYPADESVKLIGRPGAGKSTNMFRRGLKLLIEGDLTLGDIGLITYRQSMAMDLRNTLSEVGLISEKDARRTDVLTDVGTVHAIAKRYAADGDSIADEYEKKHWCDDLSIEYSTNASEDTAGELLFDTFGWLMNNLKSPEDAPECPYYEDLCAAWEGADPNIPLLWNEWVEHKNKHNLRDFEEILVLCLVNDITPDVELLMVDELHDAYPLMFKVLKMWMDDVKSRGGTVIVAGDPQQVVNSHQGADAAFFESVDLPELELPVTYRVPENHWELAKDIIGRVSDPPNVDAASSGGEITVRESPTLGANHMDRNIPADNGTPDDIVEDVLDNIEQPHTYADVDSLMVLARTNYHTELIGEALLEAGIVFGGDINAGAWTRGHNSQHTQRLSLYNALQRAGALNIKDFSNHPWQDVVEYHGKSVTFRADEVATLFNALPASCFEESQRDALSDIPYKSNPQLRFSAEDIAHYLTYDTWSVLTSGPEIVLSSSRFDLLGLDDRQKHWLRLALQRYGNGVIKPDSLRIRVHTIHASKGGEADHVILYDTVTTNIHDSVFLDDDSRTNEHRVWYVATTRAKKSLTVVENAFQYGKPFLRPFLNNGDYQ